MGGGPLLIPDHYGFVSRGLAERRTQPTPVVVKPRPMFAKGRYISPTLSKIIALVARQSDLSIEAIRGDGRAGRLVNARFCVANLAEEFVSRLAAYAVDDGMLRGQGCCIWYRARHRDRLELFPEYLELYERCRAELLVPVSP